MRVVAFAACLVLAVPATAQHQQLETLTVAQAIDRASESSPKPVRALFQFRVASATKAGSGYYLDSERNYRSRQNLAVAIRASAMPALTKKYGSDLKSALVGRTIKLIGEVRRISVGRSHAATATQVEVTTAGQILAVQ